ncbi:MAG: xylulokinase [Candidatus Thorarchaeota archaeon]
MSLLLGIDLGTTGVKCLVINERGKLLAKASEEYQLYSPKPGWAEQDPNAWWDAVLKGVRHVINTDKVLPKDIEGLAVSGQMHGSVFLDKNNQVIRPPILWCDTRTEKQCREITKRVGEKRLYDLVSNFSFEGFTAPKVLWLKENEPRNYARLRTLLLPKDYIVYRMTGVLTTDVSDAAGTLLFDVRNRRWSQEMLKVLDIDGEVLPSVLESTDVVSEINEEVARATGLPKNIKVVAGGADNTCSAVGNGIIEEGLVSFSIGSSGVVFAHTDSVKQDTAGRVHAFNHSIPNKWYVMGVMLSAGLSLTWFRESFGELERSVQSLSGLDSYGILSCEASLAPAGSEGLLFLPYLNGERTPHRNAKARGVFFGISRSHKKGHFIRAIMEGVCFGLRDCLEIIEGLGIQTQQVRITGGGAKSELWRQIQADVLNKEVVTTSIDEGPAFGAALLAGVGCRVYEDVGEAVDYAVRIATGAEPIDENVGIYDALYPIFGSLYESVKGEYDMISRVTDS